MRTVTVYTDYKSPYAFLANAAVYQLAADTGAPWFGQRRNARTPAMNWAASSVLAAS